MDNVPVLLIFANTVDNIVLNMQLFCKRCSRLTLKVRVWMGYLAYFADGICTFSLVSLSPLFSYAGYQKKAFF